MAPTVLLRITVRCDSVLVERLLQTIPSQSTARRKAGKLRERVGLDNAKQPVWDHSREANVRRGNDVHEMPWTGMEQSAT